MPTDTAGNVSPGPSKLVISRKYLSTPFYLMRQKKSDVDVWKEFSTGHLLTLYELFSQISATYRERFISIKVKHIDFDQTCTQFLIITKVVTY